MVHPFRPEGLILPPTTFAELENGWEKGQIFQAKCIGCDERHDLFVDLGFSLGRIPREEAVLGLTEGRVREIALTSLAGKPVSFLVKDLHPGSIPILSRRAAQQEAKAYFLSALRPGDIIPARVQNIAPFGLFCDIGCGFTALMRLDRCCISRLETPGALFQKGQDVFAAVLSVEDARGFLHLTGRELLGTWEENAEGFRQGQTVSGTVRTIMPYGIFVELTPNLSGLAEPFPGLKPGDGVRVSVRSILREKHKVKLDILGKLLQAPVPKPEYYITSGHLSSWHYYPGSRNITRF